MTYTAIVKIQDSRIAKFSEFETAEEAAKHCAEHGGFVYLGAYSPDLHINGETVTVQPKVETPEEKESRIKAEIEAIERKEIMPRKTREIQIQVMLFFAQQQGLTHDQLYVVNPAYKGMVDIDNQIKALRAQL